MQPLHFFVRGIVFGLFNSSEHSFGDTKTLVLLTKNCRTMNRAPNVWGSIQNSTFSLATEEFISKVENHKFILV